MKMKSTRNEIFFTTRKMITSVKADLKTSIGWQEVYHNTDTSESMKIMLVKPSRREMSKKC